MTHRIDVCTPQPDQLDFAVAALTYPDSDQFQDPQRLLPLGMPDIDINGQSSGSYYSAPLGALLYTGCDARLRGGSCEERVVGGEHHARSQECSGSPEADVTLMPGVLFDRERMFRL